MNMKHREKIGEMEIEVLQNLDDYETRTTSYAFTCGSIAFTVIATKIGQYAYQF